MEMRWETIANEEKNLDWEIWKGFMEEVTFKVRTGGWWGAHLRKIQEKASELYYENLEGGKTVAPSSS